MSPLLSTVTSSNAYEKYQAIYQNLELIQSFGVIINLFVTE